MQQFFDSIGEMIRDNWIKFLTAGAFTVVGWWLARWRAAQSWKKREFFNRLNISLNSIHDGKLLIRTVAEKNAKTFCSTKSPSID